MRQQDEAAGCWLSLTHCCKIGPASGSRLDCNILINHAFVLQVLDEAASLLVALLDPQAKERVLDACATPEGKALFAAAKKSRNHGETVNSICV